MDFCLLKILHGTVTISAGLSYNTVTVGTGQYFVGIVGFTNLWVGVGSTDTSIMSIKYTSPQSLQVKNAGSQNNTSGFVGLFSIYPCDIGYATCSSPALSNCLTCDLHSNRAKVPDASNSNKYPCFEGFCEDASGKCVPSPSDKYCKTCALVSGSVNCRELVNFACPCRLSQKQLKPRTF